ncbi:MAG: DinB family protein [Pyrinomonadaceae bacterium]
MSTQLLVPRAGLPQGIGYFVSAMEDIRRELYDTVKELEGEPWSRPAFLGAHAIGALVLHIGEAEWWWMQCNVAGHELTPEDRKAPFWDVLDDPKGFQSKNYDREFCLRELDKIRKQTFDQLYSWGDGDLDRVISLDRDGETREYNLRWVLHHLIDHEAQHRGQILMLKRLMAAGE